MSRDFIRQCIAASAIAAAIIAAVWMFLAAPAQDRRASAQDRLDNAAQMLASLDLAEGVDRGAALQSLTARARAIDENGLVAREPLHIYDAVLSLADAHQVQIDRMDPAASAGAVGDETVVVTGFEIEAIGAMDDILAFMDAIEQNAGFARIVAATLEPRLIENRRLVSAVLRTRHFAFDLGDANDLLTSAGDAP